MSVKKTCSICLEDFELMAYASCRHFMCVACCWTLRGIVGDTKCPICRDELPWVALSKFPYPEFDNEDQLKQLLTSPQSAALSSVSDINLYGSRQDIDALDAIRAPQCTQCNITFDSIHSMSKHHRAAHKLQFCYVCVEYLKKLPKDYELFRSSDLSAHLKIHPKCVLCDKYVLNESVLRSHRKTSHFQCEVCDQSGRISVFNSHTELSIHFKDYHFLCEYGDCVRFGLSVFASKIEYHRHLAQQHTSLFSKEQRKRLLDFTNDDFMQFSQPIRAGGRNAASTATQPASENNNNTNQRNIIDIVNEMRIAEESARNQHSLLLNDDNFPHLNSTSRRIEADLPPVNLPCRRFSTSPATVAMPRSTYPTVESSVSAEFPALPSSTLPNTNQSIRSTQNRETVSSVVHRRNDNPVSQNTGEDFPSFPQSDDFKFPGEHNFWNKGPKVGLKKKPASQNVSVQCPQKNGLAYSLGLRNLDVALEGGPKRKKKKKNSKSSPAQVASSETAQPSTRSQLSTEPITSPNFQPTNDNSSQSTNRQPSLYELVKSACKNDEIILANFMQICANFARGQLTALELRRKAISIVGKDEFDKILPKLAEEMPDQSKSKSLTSLVNYSSDPPKPNNIISPKKSKR